MQVGSQSDCRQQAWTTAPLRRRLQAQSQGSTRVSKCVLDLWARAQGPGPMASRPRYFRGPHLAPTGSASELQHSAMARLAALGVVGSGVKTRGVGLNTEV
jgi:hypothetical protein